MARRRIFWHIGTDDLGTGFLAAALDVRRERLAEAGVLVPGTTHAWELATAELRRNHQQLGYRRREVEGQNAALVRLMWRHKGTSVISMPGLASATQDQVMLALDGLRGAEIHLVLVARDLTSQVYAAAQAALEFGATTRPRVYAGRVLEDPEHPQSVAFRAGHDLPDIVNRWARSVPAEHVHVIGETEPEQIWRTLTGLIGADVDFPAEATPCALDLPRLEVLRELSVELTRRVDAHPGARLDPLRRRTVLRDRISRETLAGAGAGSLPDVGHGGLLAEWTARLSRKGVDVHGSLLGDAPRAEASADAETATAAAFADAIAELGRLQAENRRLTEENERLDRKRRKHRRRARELAGQHVA